MFFVFCRARHCGFFLFNNMRPSITIRFLYLVHIPKAKNIEQTKRKEKTQQQTKKLTNKKCTHTHTHTHTHIHARTHARTHVRKHTHTHTHTHTQIYKLFLSRRVGKGGGGLWTCMARACMHASNAIKSSAYSGHNLT